MFWKKKVKYDRLKAYLDKAGIDETADRKFDDIDMEAEILNLCRKGGGEGDIMAQMSCSEDSCFFYFDPENEMQKEKFREICIETGVEYSAEECVDMDFPEDYRFPQKWSIMIYSVYWKRLVYLLMKEVFGAEDFDIYRMPPCLSTLLVRILQRRDEEPIDGNARIGI